MPKSIWAIFELQPWNRASRKTSFETEPLLQPTPSRLNRQTRNVQPRHVYIPLFLVVFLLNLALQICQPALARILESVYCQQYYDSLPSGQDGVVSNTGGMIDESRCKIPIVQERVAKLRGGMELWDALPSLILSIPFGILSDRIGRKWLFRVNLIVIFSKLSWAVIVCASGFPLHTIYLYSILNLISGGNMFTETLFTILLTDVVEGREL